MSGDKLTGTVQQAIHEAICELDFDECFEQAHRSYCVAAAQAAIDALREYEEVPSDDDVLAVAKRMYYADIEEPDDIPTDMSWHLGLDSKRRALYKNMARCALMAGLVDLHE